MAHKLADETLGAILCYFLSVDDVHYACTTASKSPFANDALSSSAVLLVCKRWLRVATPLLYGTVILRSPAQSSALAAVLKRQPVFGTYIRKVRVEGGVGASICKIFKAAPNITDLCLTLDLYASDNVSHMYKALFDSVSPRRLVLCSAWGDYLNGNKPMNAAIDALEVCISQWTSLRVLTLAENLVKKSPRLYDAICKAQHLELIHFPQPWSSDRSRFLSRLAECCSAPVIRVGWSSQGRDLIGRPKDLFLELSPVAQKKVQFAEAPPKKTTVAVVAPASNPSYTPLSGVSQETRRTIWSRIIDIVIVHTKGINFDLFITEDNFDPEEDTEEDLAAGARALATLPRGAILQCMSVCKEWKYIATNLACRYLRLASHQKVQSFMKWVISREDASELVSLTRTLELGSDRAGEVASICDQSFLGHFINLRSFHGGDIAISPITLRTLAMPHLSSLKLRSSTPGTYILPPFPSLRTMEWTIELSRNAFEIAPADANQTLPVLETLKVWGAGAGKLLAGLSKFKLPAITSLTFNDSVNSAEDLRVFCTANGGSIRKVLNQGTSDFLSVLLPTCPALKSIELSRVHLLHLAENIRKLEAPHTALEEITYPTICVGHRYNGSRGQVLDMQLLTAFCNALESSKFPAMRTVHIPQWDLWPEIQRDLIKHPLPALAEEMLERGIRIVNMQGKGWKPRLGTTKKKS